MTGQDRPTYMKTQTHTHSKLSILAAITCGTLALSSHGKAAVVVKFQQVGEDVVATWNGDIHLGAYSASDSTTWTLVNAQIGVLGADESLAALGHPGNPGDFFVGGAATATSLLSIPFDVPGGIAGIGPGLPFPTGFGFVGDTFMLPNFPGDPVPYFDFGSGSNYTMKWSGRTLSEIGADSFDNTLAWTSSVSVTSTISYTTVPETSTLALGMLGGACLLRRRR